MECPACGHDTLERLKTPLRSAAVDERYVACKKCGVAWITEERIVTIFVLNPETLERDPVPISQFTPALRLYLNGRAPHPHNRASLE